MKTPNFSLKFILAMGFPFVLLAITPTKVSEALIDDELEGSGTDSEDDDFYSGSGSGDGFMLKDSYSNAEHTTYHTLPSTASSNLYSSSQVTTTKITSEMIREEYVNIVPVHHDLPVVNATIEATVTSPISSTVLSKDIDIPIVPRISVVDSQPRGFEPKHDFMEVSSASPNVHTTFPGHAVTVIDDESLAASRVVTADEMMSTVIKKADPTEEVVDMRDVDMYFTETLESTTILNQNQVPDSKTSAETPQERYSHDASASGSFLERSELLAATVAGGFVGLVLAVLLVVVLVYRMKKKDEGSYTLDESKQPNGGYQKPQKQEEFYA
ncbi:syndecan-1-like [Carcharodon carcharias]|uniref:syndecan-1-like n=1 Tax=Carcharodon carcharias TaxID=13397 RepID=UPI001B7EB602|nr:syndecan-1-like [Carcharodon carcharias]